MTFQLHPRLQQDCLELGKFNLCRVLLMNDSRYPWFILVPEVLDKQEIYQLNSAERSTLLAESCHLAATLTQVYPADKLNIATIGNKVPQLHVHHIVRYQTDCAWPEPVWGKFPAQPYSQQQLADMLPNIKQQLALV
jgi:diadenosine tetraphosphate (Ap4A) HIT family hydrolase